MILILLALWLMLLSGLYPMLNEKQRRLAWFLACFSMWFLLAFRSDHTGADTIGYVRNFHFVRYLTWGQIPLNFTKDTGFWYLSKALSCISVSDIWYLGCMGFLSCLGVWDYLRRNTEEPVLALFFFVTLGNFLFIMTGMRQSVAMSMCLLSLRFAEKKNIPGFLFWLVLGGLCHKSAFLFLPMYYLARRKLTFPNMIINVSGITLCVIFYSFFLQNANELLGYSYEVEEVNSGVIFYLILLLALATVFFRNKPEVGDVKTTINTNMAVIAAGMWTIRLFSRTIERICMYWLTAIPVVLTNALTTGNGGKGGICKYLWILIALLLFAKRAVEFEYHWVW